MEEKWYEEKWAWTRGPRMGAPQSVASAAALRMILVWCLFGFVPVSSSKNSLQLVRPVFVCACICLLSLVDVLSGGTEHRPREHCPRSLSLFLFCAHSFRLVCPVSLSLCLCFARQAG